MGPTSSEKNQTSATADFWLTIVMDKEKNGLVGTRDVQQ